MSYPLTDSVIASALRSAWRKSEARDEALARTKVKGIAKGHLCDWCQQLVIKPDVDHIRPMGPTPYSRNASPEMTWDRWIERLRVPSGGLQVLCKPCHKIKTKEDRDNGYL